MPEAMVLPPEELQRLLSAAQKGDHEAFGKVYDAFLTPVYRYVVFRFPEDLAEDLVADIFVKAWEKLHTYRARAGVPFAAWLFRIARHTLIDAYRRHRGFQEISEHVHDESPQSDPMVMAERMLSVAAVRGAIGKMPRRYRDVLLLLFVAGLSTGEVARTLKTTEGSVRIRKLRALRRLSSLLPPSHRV